MTRVKLCGITREEDRDAAVAAGADAVGFIVDVNVESPREISARRAAELVEGVPPFVTTVLVTMPDSVEEAVTLLDEVGADAVQVHSTLAPEYVGGLRARVTGTVLAAVGPDADLRAYADAADALLVDSVDSEGGGGTGETQDWERTRDLVAGIDTPVVLAGGLTPENVRTAVETVAPYAVDTASGVEAAGGIKDHDAMSAFVARATGTKTTEGVDA
ncbi:phosphoribosylanthranilate isomerase [Salinibaculum salinum]|uniref:phosphoribosylanthranilate isomerase n=1 Tax=Salinibaculum salinum TaxID=3131996 RepID=UPI0030EDC5C3